MNYACLPSNSTAADWCTRDGLVYVTDSLDEVLLYVPLLGEEAEVMAEDERIARP